MTDRRTFLLSAAGVLTAPALSVAQTAESEFLRALSTECANVLREMQGWGYPRAEQVRRLASCYRLAAAAQLDRKLSRLYTRLRRDPEFKARVLDTDDPIAVLDKDLRLGTLQTFMPATRAQRVQAIDVVLSQGIRPQLLRFADTLDRRANDMALMPLPDGAWMHRVDAACAIITFDAITFSFIGLGLNYWTAVTLVATPELLLIIGTLAITANALRYFAC